MQVFYIMKKNNFLNKAVIAAGGLIPLTFVPYAARAQITIVATATVELNFGTIAASTAGGGDVTINTAGGRSSSGSVTLVNGAGLESAGVLSISGSTGINITLSMTSTFFNVTNGGGDTMRVDDFNLVTNAGGPIEVVTLPVSPTTFPLGGTLNIATNQAAGTYLGTFNVSAIYQ